MGKPKIATANQVARARKLADDVGHSFDAALVIILDHDQKVLDGQRRGLKALERMKTWGRQRLHGIIPLRDQEALAHAEILGYAEDLLTGQAKVASERQVENEVLTYLFAKGATYPERLRQDAAIPPGQLLVHRLSQSQRPKGMSKGISDLSITRYEVWPGWYQVELKARGKGGTVSSKAKIYPEQKLQADHGLSTLAWHPVHVAVLVYTLDAHFTPKEET